MAEYVGRGYSFIEKRPKLSYSGRICLSLMVEWAAIYDVILWWICPNEHSLSLDAVSCLISRGFRWATHIIEIEIEIESIDRSIKMQMH